MREFIQESCQTCKNSLGDGGNIDIVVCPVCGAPYHRECYDKTEICVYEKVHGTDAEYKIPSTPSNDGQTKKCPRCLTENPKDSAYCSACSYIFSNNTNSPFNLPNSSNVLFFDPLAGVDPKEEVDNINFGDIAKFVRANTPYYLPVFKKLKDKNKSKFNFGAFLLGGTWFLFRKQYWVGWLLTFFSFIANVLIFYFQYTPSNKALISALNSINTIPNNQSLDILNTISSLDAGGKILFCLPILLFLINIFSGFFANRLYFKHSIKKLKEIKLSSKNNNDAYYNNIQLLGGVNIRIVSTVLLLSIFLKYLVPILFT